MFNPLTYNQLYNGAFNHKFGGTLIDVPNRCS